MIAVHLLTKEAVAERLAEFGCSYVDCGIEETSGWKTPWGFHFTLPELPPDGMTPEYILDDTIEEIKASKPRTH